MSCAGDSELAKALHVFLTSKFPSIKLSLVEDEVYLESTNDDDRLLLLPASEQVNSALQEFKSSNQSFEKCIIKGIGDTFIVAFQVDVEEMGLLKCQWCSYPVKSKDELEAHEGNCPQRFIF